MRILIFIVGITVSGQSLGQTYFQKVAGGTLMDGTSRGIQTSDGGSATIGRTYSYGAGETDIYLVKNDPSGTVEWTKSYGDTLIDIGSDLKQTSDGGYIITGLGVDINTNKNRAILIKTDGLGNAQWAKAYGDTDQNNGSSVLITPDGGFIVTGQTSLPSGDLNIFVFRTDSLGALIWSKKYDNVGEYDAGKKIILASDGGYVISGVSGYGGGFLNYFLMKIDAAGNVLWNRVVGDSNTDNPQSVAETNDHGFIMAGYTQSFTGGVNMWISKLDSIGTVTWTKIYTGVDHDEAVDVLQKPNGNYVISGTTASYGAGFFDACFMELDASGNFLRGKVYGGSLSESANSVYQTADQGLLFISWTESFGSGSLDYYLIKTDSLGNSGCHESSFTFSSITSVTPMINIVAPTTVTAAGTSDTLVISTGTGGSSSSLCFTATSLSDQDISTYSKIYPNPSTGIFTVEGKESVFSIEVYDISGRRVARGSSSTGIYEIDLSASGKGIYFYMILEENGASSHGKMIVQ